MTNTEPEDSRERAIVDFLLRLMEDREVGEARSLTWYLSKYPGFEEDVAREYLAAMEPEPPAATAASDPDESEDFIGPYRILEELGRGGQGAVFLAEDSRLDRRVALKVLMVGPAAADDLLLRFRREARLGSKIDHPGICTIYEAGRHGTGAYIAMRYVEGDSLSSIFGKRECAPSSRSEFDQVTLLIEKAARVLHAAHEAGIIHRDVKPGNIMVEPNGEPVLLDFGLARDETAELPTLTATGDVFGTPAYMSPEQFSGMLKQVDRRTDVYSLGIVLYQALTGKLPFEAPTVQALADKVRKTELPNPLRLNPHLPTDLRVILETACEKDLGRRYRTSLDLAEELRRFRQREPIFARPAGPIVRLQRWTQRNPVLAVTFIGLVLALALVTTFLVRESRHTTKILRMSDNLELEQLLKNEHELYPASPDLVEPCENWLSAVSHVSARRPLHEQTHAEVTAQLASDDTRENRWLASLMREILERFDRIESRVPHVEARLERSRTIEHDTLVEHAESWRLCIESVATSEMYAGLQLTPQLGLVPLRQDPKSQHWEFWHLESGKRPHLDQKTDLWKITGETGMVFILLPGGRFQMGAETRHDHQQDLDAHVNESPVHEVELAPFFLSRYEMTQGQWTRVREGDRPFYLYAGTRREADTNPGYEYTLAHPTESVSWHDCQETARRLGLALPSEAQWEYACRAGTTTVWSFGDNPHIASVFGNFCGFESYLYQKDFTGLMDDHVHSAPVGSFEANPFGFHDMHGNVWEWCGDRFVARYESVPPRPLDGLRAPEPQSRDAATRGGSFVRSPEDARSANRNRSEFTIVEFDLGLRLARAITP